MMPFRPTRFADLAALTHANRLASSIGPFKSTHNSPSVDLQMPAPGRCRTGVAERGDSLALNVYYDESHLACSDMDGLAFVFSLNRAALTSATA